MPPFESVNENLDGSITSTPDKMGRVCWLGGGQTVASLSPPGSPESRSQSSPESVSRETLT